MTATMTASPAPSAPAAPVSRPDERRAGPPRPLSDRLELGPHPSAVRAARRRVRAALAAWGLAGLADDAEQIAAEIVGNAVEAHQREHLDAPVRLTLLAGPGTVLIAVRDASGSPPVPAMPGDDDEAGRGLLIVEALAAGWDWKPAPGGKVVRVVVGGAPRA